MSAVFSGGYTVDADLTIPPVNTVALSGHSAQLNCTTDEVGSPARIAWRRNPDTTDDRIVHFNCGRNPSFPQYSVTSSSAGQCDLVINPASLELAATYRCGDADLSFAPAELTVIGEFCI